MAHPSDLIFAHLAAQLPPHDSTAARLRAKTLYQAAESALDQGRAPAAERLGKRALEALEAAGEAAEGADVLCVLDLIAEAASRPAVRIAHAAAALEQAERLHGPDAPTVQRRLRRLALDMADHGRGVEALGMVAAAARRTIDLSALEQCLAIRVAVLARCGRALEAIPALRARLAALEGLERREGDAAYVGAALDLARLTARRGALEEAAHGALDAQEAARSLRPGHPLINRVERLVALLEKRRMGLAEITPAKPARRLHAESAAASFANAVTRDQSPDSMAAFGATQDPPTQSTFGDER